MGRHAQAWTVRWVAALAAVVAVLLTTAAATAWATDRSEASVSRDDLGVEMVVGYGRAVDGTRWIPLELTFSPRVPITGQVVVRTDGPVGASIHREPVDVAAGATKVVHLLLPPSQDLSVGFVPHGGATLRLPPPQPQGGDAVLVGGLGTAPRLPDTLTATGSDRPIRAVAVDPALLAAGPRALEALDALVLPSGDLASSTEHDRRTLAVAVAQGLDLVVPTAAGEDAALAGWNPIVSSTTGADGPSLQPAPTAWAATGADLGLEVATARVLVAATSAGDGRVVATAVAPGDGDPGDDAAVWAALFQPRADAGPPFAAVEQGGLSSSLFGGRLAIPGTLGFALFVVAFLLVVGPLNVVVLRRWGRRELAWATVPTIAVLFALIAVAGATTRAPTTSPVLRASWWFDGVGEELTAVALQSPSRGTVTVDLDADADAVVAEPWSGLVGTVGRTRDTTRVSVPLEALQSATVVGWGRAGPVPLEVTATFVDTALEVDLVNRSGTDLRDVEVHLATHVERVDDLPADGRTTVTIDPVPETLPRSRWADGRDAMMGVPLRQGEASGPSAGVALLRGAVLDDTPGPVWVTATAADVPTASRPQVRGAVDDRGSILAVGATATRTSGATSPFEVQRQLLSNSSGWRISPLVVEGADRALVRFRLPAGRDVGALTSTLDAGGPFVGDFGGMDVGMMGDPWSGGCWEVTLTDADGVSSEPEERCGDRVACPDDAGPVSCEGGDRQVQACFDDGSCQDAIRIGDVTDPGFRPDLPIGDRDGGDLAGVEVYDHTAGAFVPAADAFPDGIGDADRLVSPLGEVLLRVRGGSFVDLARRGLGVAVVDGPDRDTEGEA